MKNGYFKISRKLFDNDIWFLEPFTKAQAWIDLIGNTNHSDNEINIRGNMVKIKRGQLGWSELTMAKRWKWSRTKVRRFLNWLKTRQQIEQQKSNLTSITTILNYELYQSKNKIERQQTRQQTIQQKDSRKTADDTQLINDKEMIKNDKEKKETITKENILSNVVEIINYLNETSKKNFSHKTEQTQKLISARLKEGYSIDDFKKVIKVKVAEWNDTEMCKYLRPETLFCGQHFDSYLNQPSKARPKIEIIKIKNDDNIAPMPKDFMEKVRGGGEKNEM